MGPLSDEGGNPNDVNNPNSTQNFAMPKMQMIHEDANPGENTLEAERINQKPYSAAHAQRKQQNIDHRVNEIFSEKRGRPPMHGLSKQSTNFTGVGGAMAHQRMGDSYGFKSSNLQTGAGSQVGKKAGAKSGTSSMNGYAGRGIGISKSLNRPFKPLRDQGKLVTDNIRDNSAQSTDLRKFNS